MITRRALLLGVVVVVGQDVRYLLQELLMARPFIPYTAGSFLTSSSQGAPIDEARTKTMQSFMASFADQKKWKFPSIQGVGGNLWGTAYAMSDATDPIWKLTGAVNSKVADQLKNKGFHAPAGFGKRITGTSDSPFC